MIIPAGTGPVVMGDVMADFQLDRFKAIGPSLGRLTDGQHPPITRFWLEATKGASKDSDLALCMLWPLLYRKRFMRCQVGAKDLDQASEIREIAMQLFQLNPWMAQYLDLQARQIVNRKTGSIIRIETADESGSHGGRPDLVLINELTHMKKQEFAETLMDNADKKASCIVLIATNAGERDTWQWRWREDAINNQDRWWVQIYDRPSPWISEENIKGAENRDPPSRFRRLWWGEWGTGRGDALSDELITAAVNRDGGPMTGKEKGWWFTAGLDLGVSHDHAGLVVVGTNERLGRLRLGYCQRWEPDPSTGEVDLIDVEDVTHKICKQFGCLLYYDPFQAKSIVQRLNRAGIQSRQVSFQGKNAQLMASILLQVFREKRIDLYDGGGIVSDLRKLSIVEKNGIYRLDAPRDEMGHADVATALCCALPPAFELLSDAMSTDDFLGSGDDDREPLTEEEIDELPDELREILQDLNENGRYWDGDD